jgi:cell wall-associated NlpC family hydrolase
MTVIGTVVAAGIALPASVASAAPSGPAPTLNQLVARANAIAHQIDELGQQYDALRIQYTQAQDQARIARLTVAADERLLAIDQGSIAKIAAAGYMTGGINPAIQLLQSTNPQLMLSRASILTELQRQNSSQLNLVAAARAAAQRAKELAAQQEHRAAALLAAMNGKRAKIQAKENILNSKVYAQALAQYQQTGTYPAIHLTGDSVGVQALKFALTKVGDPYVWGAAGPSAFDCSGLVMWAYAQIGISLPHFTGDQWNSGIHVPRSQLQPGDLIFFFADLGHVGIYVGNGYMLDAPTYGIPVGIHAVFWSAFAGAVRIA